MSYISSLYHIVFSTYRRKPVLNYEYSHSLYAVIASEIKASGCKPVIVNGTYDHIHILLELNASISLSSLVRDIKSKSSVWARRSGLFPLFEGWEHEYAAFSLSNTHKQAVYDYILSQKEHHKNDSTDSEYRRLILKAGLVYYEPLKG